MMTSYQSNFMPSQLLESTLFLQTAIPWTPSKAIRLVNQNRDIDESSTSQNNSIHTIPADWVVSASGATNSQYAMLHSYSPRAIPINSFTNECGQFGFTNQVLNTAAAVPSASTGWSRCLQLVETGNSVDDILATSDRWPPESFSTVRRLQKQTMTIAESTKHFQLKATHVYSVSM
ncbi:hypothetical protein N7471_005802 [Penicillium samsonianum]|uniref:uncharacterized protein n=1 Tax=Penicillium samsonianum TaxID=1882272 RepID=UPI00254662D9|nr:uncharacterized protein N7471_005802 [Penicillium samsonianum]KAJ6139316.1 hypothetical protein N7471_005802 [Penicillium samsonianum]